jgi:hypothetical protein
MAFPSAISDIVATTIQHRNKVIADNVTKNNAVLMWLSKRGNIKTVSGGNTILEELSFAANGNAGFYSGYETLPIASQEVISAAEYQWKQAACPITISGLEQLMNSGPERMIDLLEARINVAESSMANLISLSLYSDGTGSGGKEIDGLAKQVATDPTLAGTVGGIDQVVWTFWRNKKFKATTDGGAATDKTNINNYMNQLWALLVRGGDRPDLILMDNAYWGYFVASLQDQQRFTSSESATRGFMTLKYMDADVVLDGGIGGGLAPGSKTMYMLNTKYIKYRPHVDRNMVPLSPGKRYSVNQDAEVQIIAWAGNLTMSGRQFQGKLFE